MISFAIYFVIVYVMVSIVYDYVFLPYIHLMSQLKLSRAIFYLKKRCDGRETEECLAVLDAARYISNNVENISIFNIQEVRKMYKNGLLNQEIVYFKLCGIEGSSYDTKLMIEKMQKTVLRLALFNSGLFWAPIIAVAARIGRSKANGAVKGYVGAVCVGRLAANN